MPSDSGNFNNILTGLIGDNPFAWSFWISAVFLLTFMLVKYYIMKKDSTNDFGDLISEYLIDIEPIILSIIIARLSSVGQSGMLFMALTIFVIVFSSIMRNRSLHIFSYSFYEIWDSKKMDMCCYFIGIIVSVSWIVLAYICVIIVTVNQ